MATKLRSLHGQAAAETDQLVSDGEAALLLGVSKSMVRKMRAGGSLKTIYIGSAARVRLSAVMQIVREGTR